MDTRQAQELYKKEFGVMPVDDGYIVIGEIGKDVCFAMDKEAMTAYQKGKNCQDNTIKWIGYFFRMFLLLFWVTIIAFFVLGWRWGAGFALLTLGVVVMGFLQEKYSDYIYQKQRRLWKGKVVIVYAFGQMCKQ